MLMATVRAIVDALESAMKDDPRALPSLQEQLLSELERLAHAIQSRRGPSKPTGEET
jgi:hypothetical protein